MKQIIFITAVAISLMNCTTKNPQTVIERTDTVTVEFSEYMFKNGPFRLHKQVLIKQVTKDSTNYTYYDSLGTTRLMSYSLIEDNGKIEIKTNHSGEWGNSLGLVYKNTVLDSLQFLKFQILNPPLDGDGAIVIYPEFGIVGRYSYTWGISEILTKWGDQKITSQFVDILNEDRFSHTTKLSK